MTVDDIEVIEILLSPADSLALLKALGLTPPGDDDDHL